MFGQRWKYVFDKIKHLWRLLKGLPPWQSWPCVGFWWQSVILLLFFPSITFAKLVCFLGLGFHAWFGSLSFLERPVSFTYIVTSHGAYLSGLCSYSLQALLLLFLHFSPLNFNIPRFVVAGFRVEFFFLFKGFCWILTVCGAWYSGLRLISVSVCF